MTFEQSFPEIYKMQIIKLSEKLSQRTEKGSLLTPSLTKDSKSFEIIHLPTLVFFRQAAGGGAPRNYALDKKKLIAC